MLKSLYKAIREDAAPQIVTVNERQYSDKPLQPVRSPSPEALSVKTLTAIIDYLDTNVDEHYVENLICHVQSPKKVVLLSDLKGPFHDRSTYIQAELDAVQIPFGAWCDSENFNICLQSCFTDIADNDTDRALLLKYISNIKSLTEAGLNDDGVTQTVTVKSGIASVKNATLPNPVTLRPFRTFSEIVQPASQFVFRARQQSDGVQYCLVEADGGAWRNEAMASIKQYIKDHIPNLSILA